MSDELINMIKRHEGLRLNLYKDTEGIQTIGYGHNIEHNGITEDVAEAMLKEDVMVAIIELREVFPTMTIDDIGKYRWNALVDMMFNLGRPRFLKFKKMIQAIKDKDWAEARAQAIDSKWYGQVGIRAEELVELIGE